MKHADILYQETEFPTKWFYNRPAGVKIPPKDDSFRWVWELCRCCGARMVYSEDDFNNMKKYGNDSSWCWATTPRSYDTIQHTPNLGICVMLNPDQTKIQPVSGTQVDFIQLGEDVLAVRLKPTTAKSPV